MSGHKSTLLVAQESTYGTAPGTATEKFEVENFRWTFNPSVIEDTNMPSDGLSMRGHERGLQFLTGSFGIRVGFEGFERLWKWLLGTYSSAVVDTTGRDHTFKEGTPISLTLDQSIGDIPTGKVTRFPGAFLTAFRGEMAIGGHFGGEVQWAALGPPVPNQTPMAGTPAVGNKLQIAPLHLLATTGSLKDGSGVTPESAIRLRRLSLNVEIPYNTSDGYMGSVWADPPIRSGPMRASIEIEEKVKGAEMMTALLAGTHTDLKFLFQHPTVIGAATAKREFEITAGNVKVADPPQEIPGYDSPIQRVRYVLARHESAASALVIRTRNALAALA